MRKFIIQPELNNFEIYFDLIQKNEWGVELDLSLLHLAHRFEKEILGIQFSQSQSFENLIKTILKIEADYFVIHDDDFVKLNNKEQDKLIEELAKKESHLYIENYKISEPESFQELLLKYKKYPNVKACLDIGHVLLTKTNINSWSQVKAPLIHLNNNFGKKDTHNSIYNGIMKLTDIQKFLINQNSSVSLEINQGFNTYLKNIEYLFLNKIYPFENRTMYLNNDFSYYIVEKMIAENVKRYLESFVDYAFIYGSVARRQDTLNSDVDVFVSLKKRLDFTAFKKSHIELCKRLGFTIDEEYPIEIWESKVIEKAISKNLKQELLNEDEIEIIKAHKMPKICIFGNKQILNMRIKKIK